MALPPEHRVRDVRWAWAVSVGVVVLGLVLYLLTHPIAGGTGQPGLPSWGGTTLAHIAVQTAKAEGDARPTAAYWLYTTRPLTLAALHAGGGSGAEAEYVVLMHGHFAGHAPTALPGSAARGGFLVVLVRGFDGHVTGTFITGQDPQAALSGIGAVRPLRLFLF